MLRFRLVIVSMQFFRKTFDINIFNLRFNPTTLNTVECTVFCIVKNCTLHCNVIYFQTIHILSSKFMSVIFSQPLRVCWENIEATIHQVQLHSTVSHTFNIKTQLTGSWDKRLKYSHTEMHLNVFHNSNSWCMVHYYYNYYYYYFKSRTMIIPQIKKVNKNLRDVSCGLLLQLFFLLHQSKFHTHTKTCVKCYPHALYSAYASISPSQYGLCTKIL